MGSFARLCLTLIFLIVSFKGLNSINSDAAFLGLCILFASWIFGSSVEDIGATLRNVKKDIDGVLDEYTKLMLEEHHKKGIKKEENLRP